MDRIKQLAIQFLEEELTPKGFRSALIAQITILSDGEAEELAIKIADAIRKEEGQ